MTDPKLAVSTDHGRYYTHPATGELLISVTNVIGTCTSKPALVPWAAKASNDRAWQVLPRMVSALRRPTDCRPAASAARREWEPCGQCRPCLEREIKGHHAVIRDSAADLGTRVHALAEAHVTGASHVMDPESEPYVQQYLRFLADYSIDINAGHIESAEMSVASPRIGYAGTLDLLAHLRLDAFLGDRKPPKLLPGDQRALWLIDIKTSATRPASSIYDEYILQLAALRYATEMWLPNDTVKQMLRGIRGAAVLNLRADDYALIPVPALPDAHKVFCSMVGAAKWRHGDPAKALLPTTPAGGIPQTRARRAPRKVA